MRETIFQKIKRKLHGTFLFPHIWKEISCTVLCEHSTASFSHPRKFCTCGAQSYQPMKNKQLAKEVEKELIK